MSILLLGLELYFAAMLGVSGLAKVGQPAMFADTLRRHKILPSWSIKAVSTIVPWLEIAVAVLLITGLVPILTGLLVLFLFTSFLIMESILGSVQK